ncbi:response regulator transcription factor [Actinomadura nitritigenes]|uniref:Response regulator transcription factor n=1 Tax=Actinomadura nitritigenes TaxID=134602 RepID=A0ABS3R042_9ACTN|nr:response regulator transcription factor [Actinomadura nitritigenes]MBO2439382.1 response regulator transcription factor [Actinomadura nitritigenes]
MLRDRHLRVVLAEDGALMRDGLVAVLTRFGHQVVEAVADAPALTAAVEAHGPDIVVTDVRMPPTQTDDGLRAAIALRERDPDLPVLVLSQYIETASAGELLDSTDARAVGYLLKDRVIDVTDFAGAVRQVAEGGTVIDPEVIRHLLGRRRNPLRRLTPREREVLALMAQGHSNAAIAQALTVSPAAVGKHINGLLAKLDLPPDADVHRRVLAVLTYLRS